MVFEKRADDVLDAASITTRF